MNCFANNYITFILSGQNKVISSAVVAFVLHTKSREFESRITQTGANFAPAYIAKRIRNAIISANRATASVSAKPKIAYANNCFTIDGLRATEVIRAEKTTPIPAPTPASAIVERPAPINLADCNKTIILLLLSIELLASGREIKHAQKKQERFEKIAEKLGKKR